MHNRCTNSACRADLPRHARRCPKCGKMTGRYALPKTAARAVKVQPVQRQADPLSSDRREAIVAAAQQAVHTLYRRQVVLEADYFTALWQNRFIFSVKAIKSANACGLKEAKQIADALRMGID